MTTKNLNRLSVYRNNKQWINDKFRNENTRIIPIFDSMIFCEKEKISYLTYSNIANVPPQINTRIFLGMFNDIAYFAININSNELANTLCQQKNASFQTFKDAVALLDYHSNELLTLARFMVYWHSRNQYCGKCGRKTISSDAGHLLTCQNNHCAEKYYPNMDPAIIVLVTSGSRCLLGRQQSWPEGMYSTLAGFVEPGETIEQAVTREVHEETGVNVFDIKYQASQAWLFPNSLMLAFTAIAKEEAILLDREELEDARWYSRDEIRAAPELLPYKTSIAYKLITTWLNETE